MFHNYRMVSCMLSTPYSTYKSDYQKFESETGFIIRPWSENVQRVMTQIGHTNDHFAFQLKIGVWFRSCPYTCLEIGLRERWNARRSRVARWRDASRVHDAGHGYPLDSFCHAHNLAAGDRQLDVVCSISHVEVGPCGLLADE